MDAGKDRGRVKIAHKDTADAAHDNDGDGMKNMAKYRTGTDPNDPNSVFKTMMMRDKALASGMKLGWQSATNRVYRVKRSTNLMEGFTPLKSGVRAPYFYMIELESGP